MKGPMRLLVVVLVLVAACTPEIRPRTVVVTAYPIAWGARHLASVGYGWRVIDLSPPPGTPAEEIRLTEADREAIRHAEIVLYFGDIGFQPEVEEAVKDAEGEVVDLIRGRPGLDAIPRIYQDPWMLHEMLEPASDAFAVAGPAREYGYIESTDPGLRLLSQKYGESLAACRYELAIVPRRVYQILVFFGFRQLALTGPGGSVREDLVAEATRRIAAGEAGAVFYDPSGPELDGLEAFAERMRVPALPLDPMDSQPASGDYFSVAQANLENLQVGLGC